MQGYPNYSWGYNPYLQGTQMSLPTYQQPQMQQQMSQTQMSGRFVNDVAEITANDVPMTGTYAIFPKQDMSEIYAKAWDSNGQIKTIRFKADIPSAEPIKPSETSPVDFTEVNERLDRIEKILSARNSRTKKEAGTDD